MHERCPHHDESHVTYLVVPHPTGPESVSL